MTNMSEVAMAEVSMDGCRLDIMPCEILLEIFRRLPKSKLIEISRLSSKFRDVAGDTRNWKDVFIGYGIATFAFEDLYSEPWPVKAIDLSFAKIKPPVSSKIDQVVKVTKLNLSHINANKVIMEAIFAKYQCKELYLDLSKFDFEEEIAPEAFKKQTALEVLLLKIIPKYELVGMGIETMFLPYCHWLEPVLRNCQNLKMLCLSHIDFNGDGRIKGFVESLPKSLEKLFLIGCIYSENYLFDLLAESIQNLRELGIYISYVKCTALPKFQLLEALHINYWSDYQYNISDFCMYLMKYPALKTIYLRDHHYPRTNIPEPVFAKFRTMLEPHGIIVRPSEPPKWTYSDVGGYLWHVKNKDV